MDLASVVRRARAGDEQALSTLCAHYHPLLCRFFAGLLRTREGAEDLAQDTLVSMLRSIERYRALPGKSFEGWLLRIGYNRFLDAARKRRESPLPEGFDPPGPSHAEDALLASEDARALAAAMGQLDEESLAMVSMRYHLEMDYRAIAQALQTTPARVKWRLNDALQKLRKTMQKGGFTWTD